MKKFIGTSILYTCMYDILRYSNSILYNLILGKSILIGLTFSRNLLAKLRTPGCSTICCNCCLSNVNNSVLLAPISAWGDTHPFNARWGGVPFNAAGHGLIHSFKSGIEVGRLAISTFFYTSYYILSIYLI